MRSETGWEARPAASGLSMKIYFCDVCNESIPLKDINSNRISIEDGKIICPKCAPKAARKRDTMPGGLMALFAVMFVGLAALAVMGALQIGKLADQIKGLEEKLSLRAAEDMGRSRAVVGIDKRLLEAEGSLREVTAEVNRQSRDVGAQIGQLRDAARENAADVQTINEGGLVALARRIDQQKNDASDRFTRLQTRVAALRGEYEANLTNTKDNLGRLEDLIRDGRPAIGESIASDPGSGSSPGSPSRSDREILDLIAQLSDPNDGVRFAATADLGNYTGERVILALEKMVEDPADFVRKMAIRNLNKLKAMRSVPLIIQALRDEDPYVRKAAMAALRSLTSQEFAFDPEASASQRETRVKQWERWWSDNRSKLLGK